MTLESMRLELMACVGKYQTVNKIQPTKQIIITDNLVCRVVEKMVEIRSWSEVKRQSMKYNQRNDKSDKNKKMAAQ